MGKIAMSMDFERHILSNREREYATQWASYGETAREIAYEGAMFGDFTIRGNWLTAGDIETLRQWSLVYPEDEEFMVTAAMEMILSSHKSD